MVRDDEDNAASQARADRALNLEDSTSDFPLDDLFGGPPSDDPEVSPLAATLAPDASAEASRLRPGDRLDHYELIGELGRGGMGVVYAARDTKLGRNVAIKQILIQGHPRLQERFVREAMAMAKLSHPNVVPIHEIGEHEGSAYIVMEYVEGQTLKAWMTQPRSLDAVLEVFAAAGAGLVAAHAKGLVHRDFKPDNIMLGEDGRVRVMDFGLARTGEDEREPPTTLSVTGEIDGTDGPDGPDEADASPREGVATSFATSFVSPAGSGPMDGPKRTQVSFTEVEAAAAPTPSPERDATLAGFAGLTRTGALLGTPAYMSPEQLRGDPVGPASDQFSFCVALYEAVHGVRPFDAGTLGELEEAIHAGRLSADASAEQAAPTWLEVLIRRGLSRAPGERFPSMAALLHALESGLRELRAADAEAGGARSPAAAPPRRRARRVVLGLAVLLLLGVSALALHEPMEVTASIDIHPKGAGEAGEDGGEAGPAADDDAIPSEGAELPERTLPAAPRKAPCVMVLPLSGELPEADQALRTGILQILDGTLEPTHLAPLEPAWFVDRERLRELGAPAGARVPEPLMAELADKRGCEQILHGRIAAAGEAGYTLNLELDRRVPRGEAEDAPPSPPATVELGPAPLLDAIDDASEWLGRELSPGRRLPTRTLVRDRYTADEEALRLYFAAREPFAEDDPQRKFDLAHAAFERDPTFVRAGWLAARHSRLVNANARTLELMGRAIDHDYRLDDAERLDARAFLLELEGKRALAEQAYQDALVYAPGDVDILMSLAELRMGRNDRDGAREVLKQVVSVDATHIAALRGMWFLSLNDPKRYQLSRQFAETLVELRPEDAKYHLMLGNSWLRLRELDKAKIELGRAYALEPDNPIYASGDADLEIIAGNHEKGLELHVDPVQKALEQFEANPRDREARDTYHAIAGKYARRLLMFGRTREAYAAIEAVPRWLIEHSELPPAQLLFTLNGQDENYLLAYGYAGHEEEAYALLDRLDAGEAETAQLMLLGTKLDVAIAADDRARAKIFHDEIETILAREPILRDAVGVIFTLRWHIYNEDWAAATALWDAHRVTAADDPMMQQIVVEGLAGAERWDELEVIVDDLLEFIPNYAHMHVFRAQVQWSRGEREAARASLDEALRLWAHAEPDFAPYVDAKALRARYMDAG